MKNISWRLIVIAAVILAAVIYVIPTFQPGVWPHKKINLGLDLQGGMHLVLKVDIDKAIENTLDLAASDLKESLAEEKITAVRTNSADPGKVVFTLPNTGVLETVKTMIADDFPNLNVDIQAEEGSFPRIFLSLTSEEIDFINKNKENPFFLYLAYTAPHDPLMAWPEDIARYEGLYDEGYEAIRRKRYARQLEMGLIDSSFSLSAPTHDAWEDLSDEDRKVQARKKKDMTHQAAVLLRLTPDITVLQK